MASITLKNPIIRNPGTGEIIFMYFEGERSFSFEGSGEVRTYASGVRRLVYSSRSRKTAAFTPVLSREEYHVLETWVNQVLEYRDGIGNLEMCVFTSMEYTPSPTGAEFIVSLFLETITSPEEVSL